MSLVVKANQEVALAVCVKGRRVLEDETTFTVEQTDETRGVAERLHGSKLAFLCTERSCLKEKAKVIFVQGDPGDNRLNCQRPTLRIKRPRL